MIFNFGDSQGYAEFRQWANGNKVPRVHIFILATCASSASSLVFFAAPSLRFSLYLFLHIDEKC